ncbi:MAG: type II toxin-antitoxin system RelE/ParE family toxin [Deltaproteobacteria bacterium]|nr:type II toxin-antitoxin system RelE/ParE family toxin [Nannocystaceae bacterium]
MTSSRAFAVGVADEQAVFTTPEADRRIEAIDAWWRANREKAPDLFEEELALAVRMLADAPGIGKRYLHATGGIRRVLLRSTRNHVYYVEHEDRVLVVAVWGAVKGAGPDLNRL